jgi:dipeptidyl aminopeptidase/acylaminoacyl peptidase
MKTFNPLRMAAIKIQLLLLVLAFYWTAQAQQPTKKYTIEQFYKTISYSGGTLNDKENKVLFQDNSTGIYNVYEIDLATLKKTPLTTSTKESYFAIDYVRGTNQFLFVADKGGNENSHLYVQSPAGEAKDLTPGKEEKASFMGWDKPHKAFYYASNVRNPKTFDVYSMTVSDWKPNLIFTNDKIYDVAAISDDGKYICLAKSITTDKNELYLYNVASKTYTKLSTEGQESNSYPLAFDPDHLSLYYATDEGSEFSFIVKYDLATNKKEKFFSTNWDVMQMDISENGKYHTILVNEDGTSKIRLYDHRSGKELPMPAVTTGEIKRISFGPSEDNLVLSISSDKSPVDLGFYSLKNKELKPLTKALNPEIDPNDLVSSEVVRFKSFDGLEIPAIYYKPKNASANAKAAALVWVHGGPGGQSTANYSATIQYFVNHGYAILAVNNRGSSGYGKSFYKMDNKNHGDKDLKDCVWGKKWLAEQPDIDPSKIGIYGGSYGGFMALAGIIQYPKEFAVAVDLFGVTNWLRTLKSIPPYWESFKLALYDEMGDPATDSVRLKQISPLYNTDKIKTPLLVLQGSNDPRVLQVESDEIVAGAKRNGTPIEYVLFPDEGHGFIKKENQIKAAKVTLQFLNKYIKPEGL